MRANDDDYARRIREKFHNLACQPPRNCLKQGSGSKGLLILGAQIWLVSLMPLVAGMAELS
jgi:hypothetical protein